MYDVSSLICRMSTVHPFQNLAITDLKSIVRAGQVLRYPAGDIIFAEGDPCSGFYVLLGGKVYLTKTGPQSQSTIVSVIKPVSRFNEVAGLDGDPNPITALATKDSVAWQISHDRFHPLIARYPRMGLSLLKVLAGCNRYLLTQCEDIAFRTTLGRTAKILLETSRNGELPISRREYPNLELASIVATVPETFSRSIKTLRRKGVIQCNREHITICEPHRLAELAEI
jgi:CRP-like cAMP-binding protein